MIKVEIEAVKVEIERLMNGGGKGGGTQVVEKPVYTPPPVAPQPIEAATQEDAVTPEEEMKRKREALKSGTKSLQIPVSGGDAGTAQVGTGAGERTGRNRG
jgi:hypothetical protein